MLAVVCGSLGCGGAGGLKGGAGGTGGTGGSASGGASGGGSAGNAATGGTGAGGAAIGGVGAGGTGTGGKGAGGAGTGGKGTGGKGTGGIIGAGGAASGGIGTGGSATGGSAGTSGGTGLGGSETGGAATGGAGAGGAGTGGAATGGAGAGGAGTGGQASGGMGGQSTTTKVICPVGPVCDAPMINGTSVGIGPDGCISDFCCVLATLGTGSARMLLVSGQLTLAIPTSLEYEGMQPLSYYVYASSRKPDQAQATKCENLTVNGPSKLFCPASPDSQPACGETVQLQVDYQWGTIGCYAHTDYSSFLTATVSAPVECLFCPGTPPASGASEASLPVGTECLYNNGATGCRVVRPSSYAGELIWECAPRAGADAGSNPNRG